MNTWMIICNNGSFDILNHFASNKRLVWKQPKYALVDDLVLIYLSSPYSEVKFICKVSEINICDPQRIHEFYKVKATNVKDTDKYMEIEFINQLRSGILTRETLLKYNIKCFQRPTKVNEVLVQFLSNQLGGQLNEDPFKKQI